MSIDKLHTVLKNYDFYHLDVEFIEINVGLINKTWKVITQSGSYIAQQINHLVFQNPITIDDNIRLLNKHLQVYHPHYRLVTPVPSSNGATLIIIENEYFRVFPFVENSYTLKVVQTASQALEAAAQFGLFTSNLCNIDINAVKITLPDFHNLSIRYKQFLNALQTQHQERIAKANDLIQLAFECNDIVKEYEAIKANPEFKLRVTHHDTKISNVLFDAHDVALCVIDLDTVMPGYFISDVGDMVRTYVCTVSEEETDFSKIQVRTDVYNAIIKGYTSQMKAHLTEVEMQYIHYAGSFMIYMQALRFLTDFINNDTYYGASYELHNYNRAKNQFTLLKAYHSMVNDMQ